MTDVLSAAEPSIDSRLFIRDSSGAQDDESVATGFAAAVCAGLDALLGTVLVDCCAACMGGADACSVTPLDFRLSIDGLILSMARRVLLPADRSTEGESGAAVVPFCLSLF